MKISVFSPAGPVGRLLPSAWSKRLLWLLVAISAAAAAGLLLRSGQAEASHRPGETLHVCAAERTGELRIGEDCRRNETAHALATEFVLHRAEANIVHLEGENTVLEHRVSTLEADNTALEDRVSTLEERLLAAEQRLLTVEVDNADQDSHLTILEGRVVNVEGQSDLTRGILSDFESELNVHSGQLVTLEDRVSTLEADNAGDADNDGVSDPSDNCPATANGPLTGPNNQMDSDGDGIGDVCDDV